MANQNTSELWPPCCTQSGLIRDESEKGKIIPAEAMKAYSSTHSYPRRYTEASEQNALAALTPGKNSSTHRIWDSVDSNPK